MRCLNKQNIDKCHWQENEKEYTPHIATYCTSEFS